MITRLSIGFAAILLWGVTGAAWAQGSAPQSQAVPRTIIALIEGRETGRLRETRSHQMATMPLEQLGLVVEYHRVDEPLPDLSARDDVRGVFSWLFSPSHDNALELLTWFERTVDLGKKLVVFGDLGVSGDSTGDPTAAPLPLNRINRLYERLGIRTMGQYVSYTSGMNYSIRDPRIWGFEHTPPLPPAFQEWTVVDPRAVSHLTVEATGARPVHADLVVTGPNGGIVAPFFAAEVDPGSSIRRWIINPFEYFRIAFATDDLPKPDTTTLVGRRMFYSHVDGDGWRSLSEVKIDEETVSAARVLLERVVKRYPDLPVTIAPIAAELDPDWVDEAEARDVARAFFAQPHVEVGSHTYSHPFNWSYFRHYDAEQERAIVLRAGTDHDIHQGYADVAEEAGTDASGQKQADLGHYTVPRAFFTKPYDLDREIAGSLEKIAEVVGRPVRVLQWSGDTSPYEAAVAATRKAGIPNINGGDTRFDSDYRSYGFVAPISITVGAERQIYASMSNENTYTDLWSGRYFGYRHVLETVRRTNLPIRVKPINLYYHSYSAEKVASTNALIQAHEAMRDHEIAPVTTSRFAEIAGGFYTTRFIPLGDRRWRVEGRGALQTLRFDHASLTAVDFERSAGVVGARPLHGSLYVALDPAVDTPVVALIDRDEPLTLDPASVPYLLESRWPMRGVEVAPDGVLSVQAQGYGPLSMTWIVPQPGRWRVRLTQDGSNVWLKEISVGEDRKLSFDAGENADAIVETRIRIDRVGD
ncbi:MAG: hypothetical protein P1U88_04085 [Thalassobaculaceae bacterium]|nr:hypothetical protein [Thalassobaculaceae bacterium]